MEKIWILTIFHKYGANVYPAKTELAAVRELHEYVVLWWHNDWNEVEHEEDVPATVEISNNPQENIRFYFTYMEPDESYAITEEEILTDEEIVVHGQAQS